MRNNKLVYGLGGGLVYSLGIPNLLKILTTFDNKVLVSTVDTPYHITEKIYNVVGDGRMMLDSGGFTLYKQQTKLPKEEFEKKAIRMKNKFLKMLTKAKYTHIFELDNEYFRHDEDLLSPKNYCRQDVYDITGQWPVPVFKMHQGYEYWKRLCECDLYPQLAIGGFAATRDWHTHIDEVKIMMDYARACGKTVHLLGCQNVEAFKAVKPDSVDYSIFQYAINLAHAKKEYPNLTEYADLKVHAALYAFARAKSRSFLYDQIFEETTKDC